MFNVKKLAKRLTKNQQDRQAKKETARKPLINLLESEFGLDTIQLSRDIVDLLGVACDVDHSYSAAVDGDPTTV